MKAVVLKECTILDLNGIADQWNQLNLTWDMGTHQLQSSLNGAEIGTEAINVNAGGFSYVMIFLENTGGNRQELTVARVEAESLQGGISGIEFSG